MDVFTKNRVTSWVIILLVILNVFSLGTMYFLHLKRPPHPPERRPDPVQGFLKQELQLTQEQAQQFEKLREQHMRETKALVDSSQQLKGAMIKLVFSSSPDTATLEELAEKIGEKQAEIEKFRFAHFLELKAICQPEQLQKFQALFHEIFPPINSLEPGRPPGDQSPEPPREAIVACQGKNQGDSCQFVSPHGTVNGQCRTIQEQLACVPEGNRPGGSPMEPPPGGPPPGK